MNISNLATRIRTTRIALGLSKSELARRANIDHTVLVKLEKGEYQFSRYVFDISDGLGVNVDWLVRGRGEKSPTNCISI